MSHYNVPDSHGAPDEPWLLYSTRQRAAFLGVLFLVGASNNIDRNILGVLLPQIKAEFVLSDTELGLLSGVVFAFFYATLGLPLARWADRGHRPRIRSEEHTSELQSLMRISYAVFCLKQKKTATHTQSH